MKALEKIDDPSNHIVNKENGKNLPEEIGERINKNYHLLKRGAMNYIVNSKGSIVSNGYHKFELFKHGNMTGIIGTTGAMSHVLTLPENENEFFQESPAEFHDLRYDDELGLLISTTGAMSYIVDVFTGKKISDGFHSFFMRDGKLYGEVGSREEEINLPVAKRIEHTLKIDQS